MSLYSKANWKTVLNNYSMNYLWRKKKKKKEIQLNQSPTKINLRLGHRNRRTDPSPRLECTLSNLKSDALSAICLSSAMTRMAAAHLVSGTKLGGSSPRTVLLKSSRVLQTWQNMHVLSGGCHMPTLARNPFNMLKSQADTCHFCKEGYTVSRGGKQHGKGISFLF